MVRVEAALYWSHREFDRRVDRVQASWEGIFELNQRKLRDGSYIRSGVFDSAQANRDFTMWLVGSTTNVQDAQAVLDLVQPILSFGMVLLLGGALFVSWHWFGRVGASDR